LHKGGGVWKIVASYGSRFDRTKLVFGLCDDCIEQKIREGLLIENGTIADDVRAVQEDEAQLYNEKVKLERLIICSAGCEGKILGEMNEKIEQQRDLIKKLERHLVPDPNEKREICCTEPLIELEHRYVGFRVPDEAWDAGRVDEMHRKLENGDLTSFKPVQSMPDTIPNPYYNKWYADKKRMKDAYEAAKEELGLNDPKEETNKG
jgi:hypothetical protein